MEPMTLVWVLLVFGLIILLFKVLKKIVSVAFSIAGIIVVVYLVIIGLQYVDRNDLRDNLLSSNNLFILEDSGNELTGFASDGSVVSLPDPKVIEDDDSDLYKKFYKVILVKKDALPEKIRLVYDSADDNDKAAIFRSYVNNDLLQDDPVDNLIEQEKDGTVEVHKESIAFKHSLREVLGLE